MSTHDHHHELSETLHGMGLSLDRLVELGESMLDVLSHVPSTLKARTGDNIAEAANARSQKRSVRSENAKQQKTIDLTLEEILTYLEASQLVATHPSPSTISRWCTVGCRGIRLESTFVAGRRKTSRQAVERFLIACSERGFNGMDGNLARLREQVGAVRERMAGEQREDGKPAGRHVQPSASRSHGRRSRQAKNASKKSSLSNNAPTQAIKSPQRGHERRG